MVNGDVVSRREAINGKISIQRTNGVEMYSDEAVPVEYLKALPSAQPEIVRCHKCIHWNRDTIRQNSNDAGWWNEAICERHSDEIWTSWKDADWFCADAERRPDAETEV